MPNTFVEEAEGDEEADGVDAQLAEQVGVFEPAIDVLAGNQKAKPPGKKAPGKKASGKKVSGKKASGKKASGKEASAKKPKPAKGVKHARSAAAGGPAGAAIAAVPPLAQQAHKRPRQEEIDDEELAEQMQRARAPRRVWAAAGARRPAGVYLLDAIDLLD
eukprot:gene10246-8092_t